MGNILWGIGLNIAWLYFVGTVNLAVCVASAFLMAYGVMSIINKEK